jgi:hypothetical protein
MKRFVLAIAIGCSACHASCGEDSNKEPATNVDTSDAATPPQMPLGSRNFARMRPRMGPMAQPQNLPQPQNEN